MQFSVMRSPAELHHLRPTGSTPRETDAVHVEVFRPRGYRWIWRSMAIGFGVALLFMAADGPGPDPGPEDYVGAVILGVIFFAAFWRGSRMRLESSANGVTVVGYFSARSISWAEIAGFAVDYGGLHVILESGDVVTARMLGKANWQTWTGRRSRNEDTVDYLKDQLRLFSAS
jgi:hypothetical protein